MVFDVLPSPDRGIRESVRSGVRPSAASSSKSLDTARSRPHEGVADEGSLVLSRFKLPMSKSAVPELDSPTNYAGAGDCSASATSQ